MTCTFTNTKRGHIIVDKVTNPSGDPQSFSFDASGTGYVDFNLTDAAAANDQTLAPGKKMASDPAYNLAAQLLAARLNVQAGAGTCPPVVTAINQAQALLYAIGFNGNGSYLKKMNPAQAALANCLATWLDDYNNNRLTACDPTRTCP